MTSIDESARRTQAVPVTVTAVEAEIAALQRALAAIIREATAAQATLDRLERVLRESGR